MGQRLARHGAPPKTAFSAIVNGHHAQPLSKAWGTGMLSSSDGQRFPVRGAVASARPLPRYFGYGRGVTYYTWTSDQFSQYGTKVIPVTSRDTTYVLDEILDNETELEVVEHTTGTAGYTDLVFALFDLLGMRFAPRIRDSGSSALYMLEDVRVEWEVLKTARTVRRRVIEDHWEEMRRIAGLLKGGHVTASLLISRLQSRTDTGLGRALQAYGRLCKTEHLLRYLAADEYRRRIGRQLNKGEALHALRRFLVFGNLARLHPQDSDALSNQAACLNLVTNAVVLWNTAIAGCVVPPVRELGEGSRGDRAHQSQVQPAGPMKRVLDFWNRRWLSVAFDHEQGQGRVRWLSRKPAKGQGWAHRRDGVWYAVWSDGSNIIFQAGSEQWPMTDEYTCAIRSMNNERRFTISNGLANLFELSYEAGKHEADPTYDDVDLEQDDFFVYTARLWSDQKWKAEVIQNWA